MLRESAQPGCNSVPVLRCLAESCIMQRATCSSPPPQISDFGLSCILGSVHSKISSNLYGTVTHQPPETLKDNVVSYAGDVYAFGVLMWQVWGKVWRGKALHPGCHSDADQLGSKSVGTCVEEALHPMSGADQLRQQKCESSQGFHVRSSYPRMYACLLACKISIRFLYSLYVHMTDHRHCMLADVQRIIPLARHEPRQDHSKCHRRRPPALQVLQGLQGREAGRRSLLSDKGLGGERYQHHRRAQPCIPPWAPRPGGPCYDPCCLYQRRSVRYGCPPYSCRGRPG